mgnify:CR=1 FL=1
MMIQDKFISLEGKVAIITGAGQGIGLAIAQLYAKYGAAVAMVDVSDKCAEEAGKIRELGAETQAFKCDVTSEDDVKKTVEAVMQAFGHIDILVNNAGIIVRKTVLDTTVEEWDRCMDIGLKGTFLFSKHVVPIMIKEGSGVIVNTASGAALKGVPEDLYEAASIDGAGKWRQFFSVTVPIITPVIFYNLVTQLCQAFQEFNGPYIITQGGPRNSTTLISLLIYNSAFKQYDMGMASAMAWVMFVILMIFTTIAFLSQKYWVFYSDEEG